MEHYFQVREHAHKKKFILFLTILFSIYLVSASDTEIIISCGGDQELIIGCIGDGENFYWVDYISEVSGPVGGVGLSGGPGSNILTAPKGKISEPILWIFILVTLLFTVLLMVLYKKKKEWRKKMFGVIP